MEQNHPSGSGNNDSLAGVPEATGFPLKKGTIFLLFFLLVIWPLSSYFLMSDQMPELSSSGIEKLNLSTQIYLPTILVQVLVFLLIILFLRLEKERVSSIGLKGFDSKNLVIGAAAWLGMSIFLLTLSVFLRSVNFSTPPDVLKLLPRTYSQKFLWLIMALSASLGEESAFRGFVLTRLNLYLKRWWLTVLIASISFSLGHLYQGLGGTIFAGIYGVLFSFLFLWRKSLAPCITAHFLQDITPLFAPF